MINELLDRLEVAEKERDEFKRECFGHISDNSLLRAKIEAMERQEPVAWLHESRRDSDVVTDAVKHVWGKAVVGALAAYSTPLYLSPGAQPAPIIPEGWKLVPIEPTPEMIMAMVSHYRRLGVAWRAALEAAPEIKP